MSILDGVFNGKEEMQGAIDYAQRLISEALPNLDDKTRHLIEATADGSSLAEAIGVTKEQKAALLDMGCRLIQLGQLDRATDVLLRLGQLDPLEEGAHYGLGVISQAKGDLRRAAQMYLQFLALDATNPIGYLRLGECLLGAKEYAQARSAFNAAMEFADEGYGQPGNGEEARRLLELPDIAALADTPAP